MQLDVHRYIGSVEESNYSHNNKKSKVKVSASIVPTPIIVHVTGTS